MKNRFHKFIKKLKKTMNKPEMRILPGQLAFFLLLSIIPLFAVIGVVASEFSLSLESIVHRISSNLPSEVTDFLLDISKGRDISINIAIFCIVSFILASNGPHSMIIGSNMLYKIEDKDVLTRRVKALLMTIILVILFMFVLTVPAFGDQSLKVILDAFPNHHKETIIIFNILKYPVSFFIIYFFVKLLYVVAPDKTIKSRHTTYGAIFTSLGWIISTEIYAFYVKKFASYNILYGSVANLIILLLWLYILSYVFILGMALNATTYNMEKEEE